MAVPAPDLDLLRQLGDRIRPLSAAAERVLPVPEVLAALMPGAGLVRGTVALAGGQAATSLALALAGPSTANGSWVAVVGLPGLGLVAAAELGVDLGRVLLVREPEPRSWGTTVASLLDAVDLVLVRPPQRLAPSVQRRLLARARDRGSVLVQVGGEADLWAEVPDVEVVAGATRWDGLGLGHGRLRARRVTVTVSGRRAAGRPRRADLWLPGPDGTITLAAPVAPVAPSGLSARAPGGPASVEGRSGHWRDAG